MINVDPERSVAYTWGSTPEERLMSFPCDRYMSNADEAYFRAIDVQAPAPVLFRWLCQLKVGSYSYDWLDHLERIFFQVADSIPAHPSSEQLLPGVENVVVGQKFMGIFQLVEFEANRHLTIVTDDEQAISIFGDIAASYVIFPVTSDACRLVLKGNIRYPRNCFWSWIRYVLPWGDLLMMRQQFLRLKHLAERPV
ncbi:hypothetical protein GNF10_28220 [Nostoc sp. UCD121]|uniref:hypothetical protein n=1 Tax=unclassified Nostoc TaxID=2593658 RepID=UPI0016282B81|nr:MULTISPECIES: hypothetical protein [unclassified Nostoc]MBC1224230.1 hypothetical protein [Nostoc sp. UCD120]MBC1279738.1 hypothetical protein [Nostoc sp. UCD121]MBC1295779.1 hypothetical protein [Nostoc sp. UCD122]